MDDLAKLSELKALVRELIEPSGTVEDHDQWCRCFECQPPGQLARIREILG